MNNFILNFVSKVSGHEISPILEDKLPYILQGLFYLSIFVILFIFLYYKYSWKEQGTKHIFFWTFGILGVVVVAKFLIYHFYKGYIGDRMLMYALPSPKAENLLWFIIPIIIFVVFLYYRQRIEKLKDWKFLLVMYFVFVSIALSVSAMRMGLESIYDPFTYTYWEYTGNLPLVEDLKSFFRDYTELNPKLANHSTTHPPGYTVILYLIKSFFGFKFLGLAVSVVLFGGLSIMPIYILLKEFLPEEEARKGLQLFVFVPSIVLFSATSMEITSLTIYWSAIALAYFGWKKSFFWSCVSGIFLFFSLLLNYLFLLLGPMFVLMFFYVYKKSYKSKRSQVVSRAIWTTIFFISSFFLLYKITGYSIWENFFVAKKANQASVDSNFESLFIFVRYIFMNIFAFVFYLGVPLVVLLSKKLKKIEFIKSNPVNYTAVITLATFLFVGEFQGEVERIWMFAIPLFIPMFVRSIKFLDRPVYFSCVLSLLFLQIIITNIMFYTYW
jgi:hypothetical protein